MRLQLELILMRGFAQFDALHSLKHVVLPALLLLLDLLLVPYFAARLLSATLVKSYLLRIVLARYCYHAYILLRGAVYVLHTGFSYLVKLHNEVRDSKYLIGTKLTNRAK